MKSIISSILFSIAFLVLGCSSSEKEPLIKDNNLTAVSGQEVDIQANGALSYLWKQTSGVDVVLVDANTATLKFMAPEVQKQELLTFELTASLSKHVESLVKEQVFVTVIPLQQEDLNSSNETNTTQAIRSLQLTLGKTSLNIDTNTTLSVIATYDDNSSKDVTNEVEWVFSDPDVVQITQNLLYTKKDTNILLQASYKNITSNSVALEIYKVINGHRLPPEPDETLNNSTLLEVDTNNNGVRDDVERWIYTYYSKPIEHAVMMQSAKAYQIVIQEPEKALENLPIMQASVRCESYWSLRAKREGKEFWLERYKSYEKDISPIQFNTAKRFLAYDKYNETLSGGSYGDSILPEDWIKSCDFNTTTLIKNP